jgi:uncharacterized Zn finger protein
MAFTDLTWQDLDEWAGSRVVGRGKSYRHAVEDLCTTADGCLLAWVQGGSRYATLVSLNPAGRLASVCTCPYGTACKHAVAMVLVYLEAAKAGKGVPLAAAEDERLDLIAELQDEEDLDSGDGDGDPDEDDNEGEDEGAVAVPAVRARRGASRRPSADPAAAVRAYLESLSPAALLELVRELANRFPEVQQHLAARVVLQSGDVAKLIASTRREIAKTSAEPGRTRHWSHERYIPDYSGVRERLEALLASGHADEVVLLAEEILRHGIEQINASDDEGETGQEIATCLELGLRALGSSSKTGAERLLWEIDVRLRDDYGILDAAEDLHAASANTTPADWSAVADALAQRLEPTPAYRRKDAGGPDEYHRKRIMRWLLPALKAAGREPEITAILTREAEVTHCYPELVDHLLAAGQESAAAKVAREGYGKTLDELPGIAWTLEARLRDIAARHHDLPLVAAFRASEFFDRPGTEGYAAVQDSTASLGLWDSVRPLLLNWLETGVRPDRPPAWGVTSRAAKGKRAPAPTRADTWPLPPTGLRVAGEVGRYRFFPDTSTLIAIAIQEKRNDDVLRWYRLAAERGHGWRGHQGATVADAVQETHPDEALAIWLRLARAEIALTKPAAYQAAGALLLRMKTVYQRTGRLAEWERLLASLRAENTRKPRLVGVLDGLAGKRSRILGP